jgi:hypothetical protein
MTLFVLIFATSSLPQSPAEQTGDKIFSDNTDGSLNTVPPGDGLTGYYYQGYALDDTGKIIVDGLPLALSRVDTMINFWDGNQYFAWQPVAGWANNYSVEWRGYIFIEETGPYGFGTISDDGSQLFIDSVMVFNNGESQWYDWEDNMGESDTSGAPFVPMILDSGAHHISVRFYENASYDGIQLWWLKPGADSSDIPYYGENFHGIPPVYNPNTNWELVPKRVLYTIPDSITSIDHTLKTNIPETVHLGQNYPNPFNPVTIIEFYLPKTSDVRIDVYNLAGQKLQTLLSEKISAGSHQVKFNAQNLSSGVYLYRIEVADPARRTGEFQDVKKMILLR